AAAMFLEVVSGEARGRIFEIGAEPLRTGSSRKSELRIAEPGIAFHHAVLERGPDGGVQLTALRSTAGTYVDGELVASKESRPLRAGSWLRFGEVQACLHEVRPTGPSRPPAAPEELPGA